MIGIDAQALPDGTRHPASFLAPFGEGTQLPARGIDNCFAGWKGTATLADARGTITMQGLGAPYCHVYAPPGEAFLCLEPVTHEPGAIGHDPASMPVVPFGRAVAVAMRIEARLGKIS